MEAKKTKRGSCRNGSQAGFSLLEVLVALVLLSTGIVALTSMSTFALRHESSAGELVRAKSLAGERIALLTSAPINQLGDGTATDTRCQLPVVENGATIHSVNCTYTASGNRIDAVVEVSHPILSNPVRMETSRFVPSL